MILASGIRSIDLRLFSAATLTRMAAIGLDSSPRTDSISLPRLRGEAGERRETRPVTAMPALHADAARHASSVVNQPSLRECVRQAVGRYLHDLGDVPAEDLYQLVLQEVEPALFAEVLRHYDGNQSRSAGALGINRATLRKKLRQYHLD